MQRSKFLSALFSLVLPMALLPSVASAQYFQPTTPRPGAFLLGTAHVDGLTDHDDIKVGRHDGRFHFIMLQVRFAPIQFDHVVIHYGDGQAQTLPVREFIRRGKNSRWIALPGGDRIIRSVELWYARANPNNPTRPEVELFGAP